MAESSAPNGRGRAQHSGDDDWGPSTPVYSASARDTSREPLSRSGRRLPPVGPPVVSPPGHESGGGTRSLERLPPHLDPRGRSDRRTGRPSYATPDRRFAEPQYPSPRYGADPRYAGQDAPAAAARQAPGRGLPGWAALLLLVGIAAIGGVIDTAANIQVRGAFNIGIVVGSAIAILAVRRNDMLPVVLAPPIVYSGAAMLMLYIRSGGLHNRHEVLNAALNYLVYGFPAIATATGVVLVIAAIRMLTKK